MSAKGLLKASFAAATLGGSLLACTPEDMERGKELLEIARICASDRPIVVIDSFSARPPDLGVPATEKDIDLNGDGINDVSHGDLVAAIYEESGKKVVTYGLDISGESLLIALEEIASIDHVASIEKPAAVSISMSHKSDIFTFQLYFGAINGLTPDTLDDNAEDMIRLLLAPVSSPHYDSESNFDEFLDVMRSLESKGIPVITAAGNEGAAGSFNLFAVFGATSIGALTVDGSEITPYSNVNSLTRHYRTGDIVTRLLDDGGIDITGDDIAEFPASQVSGGIPFAKFLNGRPVIDGLIAGILIDSETSYYPLAPQYGSVRTAFGDFTQPYRVNADLTITFDPLGNGDPRQVNLISGTSFAVPNLCNG